MLESLFSCSEDTAYSTVDETAEEIERCFANEGCVGDPVYNFVDQAISPTCDREITLSRCSSASSLVTYGQSLHPDKLSLDEQSAGADMQNQEAGESFETRWTDDKHSSYLSSMEAMFVKNLYDREYCALDICGQAPRHIDYEDPDSAESQPNAAFDSTEFKSYQNGYRRPNIIAKPSISSRHPSALFANAWIKRFRFQVSRKGQIRSQEDTWFANSLSDLEEGEIGEIAELQKHEGVSSSQGSETSVENVVEPWLEKLHLPRFTSSSTPGVQKGKNWPIFPSSMDNDRDTSNLKQQPNQSACCKRFNTGCLLEGWQEGDIKTRTSEKASFYQRPFTKQKTSGEVSE